MKPIKKATTVKKTGKEQPGYVFKFLGLQIPIDSPFTRKEVIQLFIAFLIFLGVLVFFLAKEELWLVAGGITSAKAVGWISGIVSQRQNKAP